MKFSLIVGLTFLINIHTCFGQDQKGYVLKGTVNDVDQEYVYLTYGNHTDSTKIKDHQFTFTGKLYHPYAANIYTKNEIGGGFYLENGDTFIAVTLHNKVGSADIEVISGGIKDIKNDLGQFFSKNLKRDNFKELAFKKLDSLIQTDPQHPYFGELLVDLASEDIFSGTQANVLKSKLDLSTQELSTIQNMDKVLDKMARFKAGEDFIDFEFPDTQGNIVNTKDFRGKVVLIDFWFSGCGPCYKSFPKLLHVYDRFKTKNFEIIGVALQDNIGLWRKDIERFNLSWINLKAEPMGQNPSLETYNIFYAPANFLIDENGKILASYISAEDLEQKLSGLLN